MIAITGDFPRNKLGSVIFNPWPYVHNVHDEPLRSDSQALENAAYTPCRNTNALAPQLICYSWITGISDVAFVVFVRKHAPEIQYLKATISEQQRQEFGRLVETTINRIEEGHFLSHSGIRFPQNGC